MGHQGILLKVLGIIAFTFSFSAFAAAQTVIVDNSDPEFDTHGKWITTTKKSGYYGADYRRAKRGTGDKKAFWNFTLPESGEYDVFARWVRRKSHASNAPYIIYHAAGSDEVRVNQKKNGGQWNLLGTFSFPAGDSFIELNNNANKHVVADAIKLVARDLGPTNQDPTAQASANPSSGTIPLDVQFDGSGSSDPDGTLTYHWDFGDGGSSSGMNPSYTYSLAATYTVNLTVTDDQGATDSDSLTITANSAGGGNYYTVTYNGSPLDENSNVLDLHNTGQNGDYGIVTVTLNELAAGNVDITIRAYDADNSAEGTLEINGSQVATLFGSDQSGNNLWHDFGPISAPLNLGDNTFKFIHTSTGGFMIGGITLNYTPGTPDTTPPVISAVGSSNITDNSATITWNTDEGATAQVEYGSTPSYGNMTAMDSSMGTSHAMSLTGLAPQTTCYYRVLSSDASGNASTSGQNTFTTLPPQPNQPPVANPDSKTSNQDTAVTISVISNDTDPDGDSISVTGVGLANNGTVVDNQNETVTYMPDPGFLGQDSFTYSITDGNNPDVIGTVTVTVVTPPTGNILVVGPGEQYSKLRDALQDVQSGDTIYIREGTYNDSDIGIRTDSQGNPIQGITIQGHPENSTRPILQKDPTPGGGQPILRIDEAGSSNITLKDLEFRYSQFGIQFGSPNGPITDVRIENVKFYTFTNAAIRAKYYGVDRMVIKDVEAWDTDGGEAAFNFALNGADNSPGSGSRNVIFQNVTSYDNTHNQASGIIVQNNCANFVFIDCVTYNNGEIGIASKASGNNLYIGNIAYNQDKAPYYMRGPNKDLDGDGNDDIVSANGNYLLINNVGIGNIVIKGDQGPAKLWGDAEGWFYNNTFVSMTDGSGASGGSPYTISDTGGVDPTGYVYSQNNILYQAYDKAVIRFLGGSSVPLSQRSYLGDGNLFYSNDLASTDNVVKHLGLNPQGNLSFEEFRTIYGQDANSAWGDPGFVGFNKNNDTILHDFHITPSSPAYHNGVAYDVTDPIQSQHGYQVKVDEFLNSYNYFTDFHPDILPPDERQNLVDYIQNAYTRDIEGNPRSVLNPHIGAYGL